MDFPAETVILALASVGLGGYLAATLSSLRRSLSVVDRFLARLDEELADLESGILPGDDDGA